MSFYAFLVGFFQLINDNLVKPVKEIVWNKFEPHYDISKKVAVGVLIVINIICMSICLSAFGFGTIYFYHMPTVYHRFPLNFIYNRSCIENHKIYQTNARWFPNLYHDECFPQSQILLSSPKHQNLLQEGQPYGVVIHLQVPETQTNKEIGMFMVQMMVNGKAVTQPTANSETETNRPQNTWFYGKSNHQPSLHPKKVERATSLHHTSTVIHYLKLLFLWPLYVADFKEETQSIDVVLFEGLLLEKEKLLWRSVIQLDHPAIVVKSAYIDFTAKFKGIQYFLYYWPVTSFVVGTALFFVPVLFVVSMLVYFCVWRKLFSGPGPVPAVRRPRRQRAPPPTPTCDNIQPTSLPLNIRTGEIVSGPEGGQLENEVGNFSRRSSSSSIEMLGQSPSPEVQDEITSSQISYVMTPSFHGDLQTGQPNVERSAGEYSQGEENFETSPGASGQLRLRQVSQN